MIERPHVLLPHVLLLRLSRSEALARGSASRTKYDYCFGLGRILLEVDGSESIVMGGEEETVKVVDNASVAWVLKDGDLCSI